MPAKFQAGKTGDAKKPSVAVTTGCLQGIGPEITAKAIADPRILSICKPKVFAPMKCSGKACFAKFSRASSAAADCGRLSMQAVEAAVRAAMAGEVEAIVTAPINKSHWNMALAGKRVSGRGAKFPGHTEYLAHLTGAKSVAMMMVSPRLKVTLVTTHAPLSEVPKLITKEKICEAARLTCLSLRGASRSNPVHAGDCFVRLKRTRNDTKIAICALNPHAGDSGTFGKEEETIIMPAIRQLQSEGINASGPYPADTVFHQAAEGKFDAVIAMYHDQGLAAIKTLDFRDTVNVTLGLPFVRTSPGHGTAEDIAGRGIADHHNMVKAIEMAVLLCHK